MSARVAVGFWPGDEGEPDHWYIAWLPESPVSSRPRDPTEDEVRRAVEIINREMPRTDV